MIDHIKNLIFSLLDYVVLEKLDVVEILGIYDRIKGSYSYDLVDVVQLHNQIIANIVNRKKDKKYVTDSFYSMDFGVMVCDTIERSWNKRKKRVVYEVFELSYNLILYGAAAMGERIFKLYIRSLQNGSYNSPSNRKKEGSLAQKSILIKCISVLLLVRVKNIFRFCRNRF